MIVQKHIQQKNRASSEAARFFHAIYDSYWARTSDLYPVKVALSQLS